MTTTALHSRPNKLNFMEAPGMKTAILAAVFVAILSASVSAQQRPQLNAFIDPNTGVLKTVGYVEANAPGDIKMAVPDNFAMKPGE